MLWPQIAVGLLLISLDQASAQNTSDKSRDGLWVVTQLCVENEIRASVPAPCAAVDLDRGFAIIGPSGVHILLVPTTKVSGLESTNLSKANARNYWQLAWTAQSYLKPVVGERLPRQDVAMAVNSKAGRSQDQLHIHIGCVRAEVKAQLQVYETDIGTSWSILPFAVGGQKYRIKRVDGETLSNANPFFELARGIPGADTKMGDYTLVVVGARLRSGKSAFYLLADRTDATHAATGETLLDYGCAVVRGTG